MAPGTQMRVSSTGPSSTGAGRAWFSASASSSSTSAKGFQARSLMPVEGYDEAAEGLPGEGGGWDEEEADDMRKEEWCSRLDSTTRGVQRSGGGCLHSRVMAKEA